MNVDKTEALVEQSAGKQSYRKPVLQAFGPLHLTTRGTGPGSADGKNLGDKRSV